MPLTLHTYILRELGKTFGLTVAALTVLFTLGGGIYNVMRYEGVSVGNFVTLLPMLMPIVLAVTMPVAALFSATIVYGRLAADNELTACRAAGINVHGLFLAAVLLSALVALVSMFATNVLIPNNMRQIEFFVRSNFREYVEAKLKQSGYIERVEGRTRHIVTAQSVSRVTQKALQDAGYAPESDMVEYLWVVSPTYVQVVDGRFNYFGVADGGLCVFDKSSGDVQLSFQVVNFKSFTRGTVATLLERQSLGPASLPYTGVIRPTMVDLGTLNRWREAPWESPDIQRRAVELIHACFRADFLRLAGDELAAGRTVSMTDDTGNPFTLSAAEARRGDKSVELRGAVVEFGGPAAGTSYNGPRGNLWVDVQPSGHPFARLSLQGDELGPVRRSVPTRNREAMVLTETSHEFPNLTPDPAFLARVPVYSPQQIIRPDAPLPIDPAVQPELQKLQARASREERKVTGLIHFRLSYAASALVTVAMGAILGVMFRGARMLSAFGLACIPFAAVAVVILVGKQVIEGTPSPNLGIAIIWAGLAATALGDGLLLATGVRR